MPSITQEDIFLILKLLEDSSFDELRLDTGDLRLQAVRKGRIRAPEEAVEDDPSASAGAGSAAAAETLKGGGPGREIDSAAGATGISPEKTPEGFVAIKAPMLGTFYRTPKPGAPPFVEVGTAVQEEDPVCLIEVMKLFNTVRAGVKGRVAQICVEQGQLVEYQQALFLVERTPA